MSTDPASNAGGRSSCAKSTIVKSDGFSLAIVTISIKEAYSAPPELTPSVEEQDMPPDANGVAVGTTSKGNVNFFANPVAVYGSVRPLILGLDSRSGGAGRISGLGYLNLDLSVKKKLVVYEKFNMEFYGISTNVMNHLDFAQPSMSLQSTSNWGTSKTQGNTPRQIQMGVRASF